MTRLLLLLAAEVVALSWLWDRIIAGVAAPGSAWTGWGTDVVGTVAPVLEGLTSLGLGWLLVVTVVDIVAAVRGGRGRRHAPRWIRRMVDQGVGAVLLLGVMAGPPAAAAPAPPPAVQSHVPESPQPSSTGPDVDQQADPGADPEGMAAPSADVGSPPVAPTPSGDVGGAQSAPPEAGVHVVSPGENLWVIARGRLVAAGVQAPRDVEVHAYWVRLIADNIDRLASGNPDLIHPGERLTLPPPEVTR